VQVVLLNLYLQIFAKKNLILDQFLIVLLLISNLELFATKIVKMDINSLQEFAGKNAKKVGKILDYYVPR